MKQLLTLFLVSLFITISNAQEVVSIRGTVENASDDSVLENVNIVNLNQVWGATTDKKGDFQIRAVVNDTLFFSYLGFKSIRVRVTNDWLSYGTVKIKMTEIGIALDCSNNFLTIICLKVSYNFMNIQFIIKSHFFYCSS